MSDEDWRYVRELCVRAEKRGDTNTMVQVKALRALLDEVAQSRREGWDAAIEAAAILCEEMAAAGNTSWNVAISSAAGEIRSLPYPHAKG